MDCAVRREPVPRESRHQANQTAAVHRGLANRPRPRWHRRRWPSGLPFYTPGNGPSMSAKRRNQRCRSAPQQERGARRSACAARGEAQDLSQLGGGKLEAHRPSASQAAVGANWVCRGAHAGRGRAPSDRSQRSVTASSYRRRSRAWQLWRIQKCERDPVRAAGCQTPGGWQPHKRAVRRPSGRRRGGVVGPRTVAHASPIRGLAPAPTLVAVEITGLRPPNRAVRDPCVGTVVAV